LQASYLPNDRQLCTECNKCNKYDKLLNTNHLYFNKKCTVSQSVKTKHVSVNQTTLIIQLTEVTINTDLKNSSIITATNTAFQWPA